MVRWSLVLLLAAVAIGGAWVLGAGSAGADQPPARGSSWAFDVKVVMVKGSGPALAEQPPVWSEKEPASPIIHASWPTLLKTLKGRGVTTVLLDSMTTTQAGVKGEVEQNRARMADVFERRDLHNEFRKAATLNEGVKLVVLPSPEGLEYETTVNWLLPAQAEDAMPFQGRWRVQGRWAVLGTGETLVLSHREQVREAGHEPVDVELYAFITWHEYR